MLNSAGEPRQGQEDPRAGLCPLPTTLLLTNRQLVISTLVILATKLLLVTLALFFCFPWCQPGWELFQGSCYLFSSTAQSWQEARSNCLAQGADLVVISDQKEQDYLVRRAESVHYWIGLTDQEREGEWRWVDNTPLTLEYWSEGEPNNSLFLAPDDEDCAHLLDTGLWNDFPRRPPHRWICERAARM